MKESRTREAGEKVSPDFAQSQQSVVTRMERHPDSLRGAGLKGCHVGEIETARHDFRNSHSRQP
jgi:hypothetical protein